MDTDRTATSRLVRWSAPALHAPDAACERLLQRAASERWSLTLDVPQEAFALGELPAGLRCALSNVYAQILHGEMLALTSAARFIERAPEGWARLFAAAQVGDEARHVEFFTRVVGALGNDPNVSEQLLAFGAELEGLAGGEELMVATQVLLEGFAQALLGEANAVAQRAGRSALQLPWSVPLALLRQTIAHNIARDESRHLAFGVLYLRRTSAELSPEQRRRLERRANLWFTQLRGSVLDLSPDLARLSIRAEGLVQRAGQAVQQRLREVGIELDVEPTSRAEPTP